MTANQGQSIPSDNGWTREEIHRLKRELESVTPRTILDLTTSSPNRRYTLDDVEKITGRSRNQSSGDLGAFTNFVQREFDKNTWPFSVELNGDGFASYYCESLNIAAWWRGD